MRYFYIRRFSLKNSNLQLKKSMRTALFVLLLSVIGKGYAQEAIGKLYYSLDDYTLTASVCGHVDGASATGSLNIPSSVTYKGDDNITRTYSVTGICDWAFDGCSSLTGDLIIPNSVTYIGEYAFVFCSGFTGNLTLGNSLIYIGEDAFKDCSGFTGDLVIPNSVTTIGRNAFWNCFGFTGNLIIGDSVDTISNSAFGRCSGFSGSLTIGNSVTTIGYQAFGGCSGFTGSLAIPNSVTMIDGFAFQNCSGFNGSLIIPNSVTEISVNAFENCSGFTGSLIIPNSVREIGGTAFSGCSGFDGTLKLPDYITTIYPFTFENCSGFTGSLVIPDYVLHIGHYAFNGCSGFTGNLTIPNMVKYIGPGAFSGCSGFNGNLVIPNVVENILPNAFENCSGFSNIFYNSDDCVEFDYLTTWNEFPPFKGCSGTLVIGDNVQSIPAYLFKEAAFDEVIMYGSVDAIGNCAFANCDSLQSITCWNENPPALGDSVFFGVDKDIPVHVPCGKFAAYKHAVGWEEFNNIQMFIVGWMLTVTSNEPEHCKTQVVQWPICESGEAIVRAKPAPGYRFLGWYEDDEKVSQDTLYTFFLGTSRELEARVKSITGFEDFVSIEASIYPNPTKGIVCIEAEDLKHITISNALGQIIYNSKASGNAFEYDFSKHGAGLYLIRIGTASGIAVKKVSVVR